jgi:pimeloyl-ACP methyl ester carboxylesterase
MRALLLLVALLVLTAPAAAQVGVTVPVARTEVAKGTGTIVGQKAKTAGPRTVDGDTGDWQGRLPGFGGVLLHSRGELVYEDHIWDAYGADSGQDAQRLAVQDPLNEAAPETYRVDPALQYVPGEFGVPTGPLAYATNYGDLPLQDAADLTELRLGAGEDGALWVLARTTTMKADSRTALLLLLDTVAGEAERQVGYGLTTTRGDVAIVLTRSGGTWTDLATGEKHAFDGVAFNDEGYENAIEARIPKTALGGSAKPGVAAATANGDGQIANVAFRTQEPVRDYFDKQQALALEQGTIDPFFTTADLGRMAAGANERFVPGPGYHDRNFLSSEEISTEGPRSGVLQHYGVYVPTGYDRSRRTPAQYWMHFRGGRAHIAAAVVPGIHHDMGETAGALVIAPEGRGKDKWYMGKSHVDFDEVWRDSHKRFAIDRDRTYVAGHSMGGWASWLLPVLYPDRFAATYPASGLPSFEESTTQLLENLREVPAVIFHGTEDELVPVTGAIDQAQRLQELGYRYRLYLFPGQEHYGPPIQDQWSEGVRYEHSFVRNPNPAQVTFSRSMPMEKAVETYAADGVPLDFSFDRAYWMSGLEPVDEAAGIARFDGRSHGIPERAHTTFPEAGGPALPDQAGPYAMEGQAWVPGAAPEATRNAFTATLTGARAVTLNLKRMRLDLARELTGEITTDAPLTLTLRDGKRSRTVEVPKGKHTVVLR